MEEEVLDDYVLSLDVELKRYDLLFQHAQTLINKNGSLTDKELQWYLQGVEEYFIHLHKDINYIKSFIEKQSGYFVIALKDKIIILKKELMDFYHDFTKIITDTLLPTSKTATATISCRRTTGFITTMIYDMFSIDEKTTVRNKTSESFHQAMYMAKSSLKPTDELRLELVLNYANFQHHCFGYTQEAIQVMQESIGMGLENNGNDLTPKGRRFLQAMISNITMWCNTEK